MPFGQVLHVVSDREQFRFKEEITAFHPGDPPVTDDAMIISIDRSQKFQSILGFGGAFTDAAGINIAKLSSSAQDNLLKYGNTF